MNWQIEYSHDADKFLKKNPSVKDDLIQEIKKLIHKFEGEICLYRHKEAFRKMGRLLPY